MNKIFGENYYIYFFFIYILMLKILKKGTQNVRTVGIKKWVNILQKKFANKVA